MHSIELHCKSQSSPILPVPSLLTTMETCTAFWGGGDDDPRTYLPVCRRAMASMDMPYWWLPKIEKGQEATERRIWLMPLLLDPLPPAVSPLCSFPLPTQLDPAHCLSALALPPVWTYHRQ